MSRTSIEAMQLRLALVTTSGVIRLFPTSGIAYEVRQRPFGPRVRAR